MATVKNSSKRSPKSIKNAFIGPNLNIDSHPFEFIEIFDMGLFRVAYGYAEVAQKIWAPFIIGNMVIVQYMYTKVIEIC